MNGTVKGMTYALVEGVDEVLRDEFTNIYNRSDSIIIKKQDSLTGVSIGSVLIVGNSTDSSSVTVKKNWEFDKAERQDVTVQLLANGKLVTTVIAGVEPQVVLNYANNGTYHWKNLLLYVNGQKIIWSVKETKIGNESAKADGAFINRLFSYEIPVISIDFDGNENTLLTVTNTTTTLATHNTSDSTVTLNHLNFGDSFSGGLIYALLTGKSTQDAIEFAVAASALKRTLRVTTTE